jgi:hypothetical protein
MITTIQTATRLDWSGWLLGIMGAIISGGAAAIGGGTGAVMIDSQTFNIGNGGTAHLLQLMAVSFVISALVSLAKFLQTNPVPQPYSGQDRRTTNVTVTATPDEAKVEVKDAPKAP